jgi:hypothetical protein
MNDLLLLVNHPLRGNVAGIPTSQNLDTLEGHDIRLSVRIHKILVELPHSTELELRKLHQTRTDSGRASVLELLRGHIDWIGQARTLASLHLSISSSCTALATTTHNNKYLAP